MTWNKPGGDGESLVYMQGCWAPPPWLDVGAVRRRFHPPSLPEWLLQEWHQALHSNSHFADEEEARQNNDELFLGVMLEMEMATGVSQRYLQPAHPPIPEVAGHLRSHHHHPRLPEVANHRSRNQYRTKYNLDLHFEGQERD
jgi:hypothetical protein